MLYTNYDSNIKSVEESIISEAQSKDFVDIKNDLTQFSAHSFRSALLIPIISSSLSSSSSKDFVDIKRVPFSYKELREYQNILINSLFGIVYSLTLLPLSFAQLMSPLQISLIWASVRLLNDLTQFSAHSFRSFVIEDNKVIYVGADYFEYMKDRE